MQDLIVSKMAENLIGSEIIKLAGEIRERAGRGEKIYNFTIGDFNPKLYPIPESFLTYIIDAYRSNETNYPPAEGIADLRESIKNFTATHLGLHYPAADFLVAGGSRPLIYAVYKAVVDDGDTVLFPVPSWNNNHYSHLSNANMISIETSAENNFMPSAADIAPYIGQVNLLALCSPLNPTGTVFNQTDLAAICELVLAENRLRLAEGRKPVYVMYDQIYWALTFGLTQHYNPVSLFPEMKPFTVFIDGMSKGFAATGVRVGWAYGPSKIISKMKSILGHIGAWAPRAEQVAAGHFLADEIAIHVYLNDFKKRIEAGLNAFYEGFRKLRDAGYPVDVIAPQAAIYLTVKIDLRGKTTPAGELITRTPQITAYLLDAGGIALVPFSAFGAAEDSVWYRLSVGTASREDIEGFFAALKRVMDDLS